MHPTKLSWVHCVLIAAWVALHNCIHIDRFEQQWEQVFPLGWYFWQVSSAAHSWTTPSLAGFAQQPAAWRNKWIRRRLNNILHSPESAIKGYSHWSSHCSAHRLYIITRALSTITIGSSSFILRVLEIVWHLTFVACALLYKSQWFVCLPI